MGIIDKKLKISGRLRPYEKKIIMRKSFTKLYIHSVWSTKNREKILNTNVRNKIFEHIKENCLKKEITLLEINGYTDHVHIFIDLNPAMSLAEAINLIKGESSHWINENKIIPGKFSWQKRYSAFSVSNSIKSKVLNYIKNQENHHKKMSYLDEVKKFYKEFGIEFDNKFLE